MNYKARILGSFILAAFILFGVGVGVFYSFLQMNREKQRVDHTYEVISTIEGILSNLKDVQSSQRGFVITGMEEYLGPYYVALPKIEQSLSDLHRLVSDNPLQSKRTVDLDAHVQERIKIADQVIDEFRKEGQAKTIALIKTGSGKREMDLIRVMVADMVAEERNLLNTRRMAVEQATKFTIFAGIAGIGVCFLILVAVFYTIMRESRRREMTELNLKSINLETQTISKMGDYLRGCQNINEAYDVISKNLPILFEGTRGAIYIFNNSRNVLHKATQWGTFSHDLNDDFEPDDCWALRQGHVHESMNDAALPVCPHIRNLGNNEKTYCLPMQAHGETFGLIYVMIDKSVVVDGRKQRTFRAVAEQVSLALANLKLQNALREQSIKDPLTKLFNRRYLEETLQREEARAKRNNQTIAILMFDIDFFKKVNDTHGHDGGDAVLVAFAQMLEKKVRKEDMACRLGGEEFVLVLPSASLELAIKRAEDVNASTRQLAIKYGKETIKITTSIGVAIMPDHGSSTEEVLQNADAALYEAKKTGRDKYIVYNTKGGNL